MYRTQGLEIELKHDQQVQKAYNIKLPDHKFSQLRTRLPENEFINPVTQPEALTGPPVGAKSWYP